MRIRLLLAVIAVVAASCSAEPGTEVLDIPTPETGPAPTTTVTLPPPTTLDPPVVVNPLTNRVIDGETLALMPLRRLAAPLAGFVASLQQEETNEQAIERLPASYDEADDIELYGREAGYRTILRPTRFNGTGTLAVDTWVTTFVTPQGASDYLTDYARDLAKGEDAGRAPDLTVEEVRTFAVEEVGEEAIGLRVMERNPDTDDVYHESIIGFRIGRLLGFTSLFREQDADVRLMLLEVAADLEDQIVAVLDGTYEVVEVVPPPVLASYTFEYRQTLTQRFSEVVTPPGVDDSGGGDGGGEEPPDPATTTTVVYRPRTTTTTVSSSGTVIGTSLECSVSVTSPEVRTRRRYVVVGSLTWVSVSGRAYQEVDPFEEPWAADLVFCPGWSPSRIDSGVLSVTRPGNGELVDIGNGSTGELFRLGKDELVDVGLGGQNASGISLDRFHVTTAGEGPWVVDVSLRMRGSTLALERAVGPGFYPGASVTIDLSFEAADLNDTTLEIVAPG